jgi:uncharacterized protein YebE (UPF0316 family)
MQLFWLCLKIFCIRIVDVSLGTVCTIVTVKGRRVWAAIIGFIDIFIWFVMAREALNTDSTSIFIALSYAGGFAVGTYLGTYLSDKFIKANYGVFVITFKDDSTLVFALRSYGYAVSVLNVTGKDTEKYMLFLEIDKMNLEHVKSIIKEHDPNAFVVVNETRDVYNGYFR